MTYRKPTPYRGMPKNSVSKRYATAAIVLGGGSILGATYLANTHSSGGMAPTNYGTPIYHNGQQYYIPGDSRRVRYPSKEACMQDVPWDRQADCEPVSNYHGGGTGYYGPVYRTGDPTYRPNPQYPSEKADSNNVGKRLPGSANTSGFGENGKALNSSHGTSSTGG